MTLTTPSGRDLGQTGEELASRLLRDKGYCEVTRNWRCPHGELDLVMTDGSELVSVEVKTRKSEHAGRAAEAVTTSKLRKLYVAAESFLASNLDYQEHIWRIDLVALTMGPGNRLLQVEHLENVVLD